MAHPKLYNLSRVRSEEQKKLLQKLEASHVCMFCADAMEQSGVPVVKKGNYWTIATNKFPYDGTLFHYIGIYRDHVESYAHVMPEAWPELFLLLSEIAGPECSIAMRSGDSEKTCATVAHFHVQIFAGVSGQPETHEEIIMHLGYKADKK